jgi:cbb3-type cytochrome oxidase subunit 1
MPRPRVLGQLAALFALLAVALFAVAGFTRNATHGAGLIAGNVGWFGFWISLLGLVVIAVLAAVARVRR